MFAHHRPTHGGVADSNFFSNLDMSGAMSVSSLRDSLPSCSLHTTSPGIRRLPLTVPLSCARRFHTAAPCFHSLGAAPWPQRPRRHALSSWFQEGDPVSMVQHGHGPSEASSRSRHLSPPLLFGAGEQPISLIWVAPSHAQIQAGFEWCCSVCSVCLGLC
jgi:hypothetical protein